MVISMNRGIPQLIVAAENDPEECRASPTDVSRAAGGGFTPPPTYESGSEVQLYWVLAMEKKKFIFC